MMQITYTEALAKIIEALPQLDTYGKAQLLAYIAGLVDAQYVYAQSDKAAI